MVKEIVRIFSRPKGFISILEETKNVPFNIARVYYIYRVPKNIVRGHHAHKNLQQIAFCPYGKIAIILDNGYKKTKCLLDQPEKTLYIGKGIWHEMKWLKKDSVLCVIASEKYDEDDYVRDYKVFKKMVNEGFWDDKKK